MTATPSSRLLKPGQTISKDSSSSEKPAKKFCQEPSDDELIEKIANYGAYHNNLWNKILHLICVPMVMWSLVIFFRWTGVIIPCETLESINMDLTFGTIVLLFYCGWYLSIGRYLVTTTYSCVLIAMIMSANALQKANQSYWWIYFIVGQIVGWVGQLYVGHYLVEHSPAAVVGLSAFDSALMAPIFTWWEMFFLFGYDKEFFTKLEIATQKRIDEVKPHWGSDKSQ